MSSRNDFRPMPRKEPEEFIVTKENFRIAYPKLYDEIFNDGRLVGRAEERSETLEKGRTREQGTKQSTVSWPGEEDREAKKKKLVEEYRAIHPGASLKEAILAIGRKHPELFR